MTHWRNWERRIDIPTRDAARCRVHLQTCVGAGRRLHTLLRSRRQQLHARIASALESQFPDVVETQPELLGRHFGEGGFEEKAIAYFTVAGNGRSSAVPMQR